MSGRVRSVLTALMIAVIAPMIMGSSCQMEAAMDRVRDVHSGVVASFRTTDTIVAPLFEEAGDECIAAAREAELSGSEARDHARACMESAGWYTIEEVLSGTREALAELENIYSDIEGGADRFDEWQEVATRLLAHGRRIAELLEAVGVDVPDDLLSTLGTLCQMTNCEED